MGSGLKYVQKKKKIPNDNRILERFLGQGRTPDESGTSELTPTVQTAARKSSKLKVGRGSEVAPARAKLITQRDTSVVHRTQKAVHF